MPLLPFGEYRPDVHTIDSQYSQSISDVLPIADGYGPFRTLAALTGSLPAPCRGFFFARNPDGSVNVFAGTIDRLYTLNNTTFTWTDVSAGGAAYTPMDSDAHWSFAQFVNIIIAVQNNDDPQAFTLNVSAQFADLAGNPPNAAHVAVVGSFVVLSGLDTTPFRIHWSAIGDATGWAAGTNQSDFQDFGDGGIVRQIKGGEVGIIFQVATIRRMMYSPGSDVIFAIDKIATDLGLLHPHAIASSGSQIFLLTSKGFLEMNVNGSMVPIGFEKVDRFFLAEYDSAAPQFVIGACDPASNTVLFTYRTSGNGADAFNKILLYNWLHQRWVPLTVSGEYLASLAQPGITLDGLDAFMADTLNVTNAVNNGGGLIRITVASTASLVNGNFYTLSSVGGVPNANGTFQISIINGTTFDLLGSTFGGAYTSGGIVGGSLDLFPTSLDLLPAASLPKISVVTTDHRLGFFGGPNKEAILETPEGSGDGARLTVRGFWPVTDAPTVFGSVSKRENLSDPITYTNEAQMRRNGFCAKIRDTRYARGKIRIPTGTPWTYASGIRPDNEAGGET